MAGELSINYTLSYRITLDVDKAKFHFTDIYEDCDSEEEFEEWLTDYVMANLEEFEEDKLYDEPLPSYITQLSIEEHTT